jgi:hypothetical protein
MHRFSGLLKFASLVAVLAAAPVFAQRRPPSPAPPAQKGSLGQTRIQGASQAKQPTCMQEAGISQATLDQLQSINLQTRSEVQGVCSNSSLSEQEKLQQIREIRQRAQAQRNGLISPQQRQEIQQCQKARAAAHPPAPHIGAPHAPVGPCGEPLPERKPPVPPQPKSN